MSNDDSRDEIQKSWQRIEAQARKAGLREGISLGRDSQFQESFDEGFRFGFMNGYAIGRYKGAVYTENLPKNELLDKPKLGWCQICSNPNTRNIPTSISSQTEVTNANLANLHKEYSGKIDADLKPHLDC